MCVHSRACEVRCGSMQINRVAGISVRGQMRAFLVAIMHGPRYLTYTRDGGNIFGGWPMITILERSFGHVPLNVSLMQVFADPRDNDQVSIVVRTMTWNEIEELELLHDQESAYTMLPNVEYFEYPLGYLVKWLHLLKGVRFTIEIDSAESGVRLAREIGVSLEYGWHDIRLSWLVSNMKPEIDVIWEKIRNESLELRHDGNKITDYIHIEESWSDGGVTKGTTWLPQQ